MDRATLSLNLSYVLHERSDSDNVRRQATENLRAERALRRAVDRFSHASDRDLTEAVILTPDAQHALDAVPDISGVVSVHLAAWPLLGRVLRVLSINPYQTDHLYRVETLDGSVQESAVNDTFFRSIAHLARSEISEHDQASWLFGSLVFLPGRSRLMLDLHPLSVRSTGTVQEAIPWAEAAIRDHVGQWLCPRPLWRRPAEETLPEFACQPV